MRVGDFSVRFLSMSGVSRERSRIPSTKSSRPIRRWRSNSRGSVRSSVARVKTRKRVKFGVSNGAWGEMETSINTLIDDLLWPTTEVTRAIAAVAQGDLLQTCASMSTGAR